MMMTMKRLVLTATVLLAFGPAVWAGGDKLTQPLVDPSSQDGGTHGFKNGLSLGSVKQAGCTVSIAIKGLTGVADGDLIRCLLDADTAVNPLPAGAGNTAVFKAAAAGGSVKMKGSFAPVGCGTVASGKTIVYNSKATCYAADPDYDPAAACTGNAMAFIAAPAGSSPNFEGVCQGATVGKRLPPPDNGVIAEAGATILVGSK